MPARTSITRRVFGQVKVCDNPYYGAANFPCFPRDGEGHSIQKKKLHNNLYLYFCAIYEIVALAYLGSDVRHPDPSRQLPHQHLYRGGAARSVMLATSERSRLQTYLGVRRGGWGGLTTMHRHKPSLHYAQPACVPKHGLHRTARFLEMRGPASSVATSCMSAALACSV